ncbi:phage terminase large subunit [Agrobacterium sp. SHOUNA12C]|nr:phage terminase large subunit [Rhizobium rhizogenes]MCJ9719741.1 phage terminase large subunit [Agrobacterium sp. BETTINA12B]MCJ9755324.1 phage terminase large subunit [Agrobacterium sp. SHOUNA12C]WEO66957.1 phage terminase large subunit [Rhizobium rhizogenes]
MMAAIREEKAKRKADAERVELARRIAADAERIRERCQPLAGFVREAWHVVEPSVDYVHGWHIDAICRHLEAVTSGEITRLLINVPPGTMKSLLCGVFWPAWEWGPRNRPELRYLGSSYSEHYAKRDNRRMRDLVASEWYQTLWGDRVKLTRSGEMAFANTRTGFRQGVPFSRLTGGRGDRVIIDDPHSVDGAESEAERLSTVRTFRESVPTRLNDPQRSAIVVVMQRLHEADVSGTILALGLGYEHLMLPMEFEPERCCRTSIGFTDPRTEEGELLFPERFPRAVVERDKVPLGSYAVAGQFQQRPSPRSGGLFQRGDFEIVDAVPAGAKRCRAWDFAASKARPGRQPDWTVGLRMAEADGIFFVETIARGRWSPAEVERNLKNMATQDGPMVMIRMPQDPGAAGKADAATKIKLLAGFPIRVLSVTGDKATRAKPASAQAEAGNVKLVRGDWNEVFLDEICAFPNAQFDDQVDAFADALNELALGSSFSFKNF